ncbi:MAG: glycosyltransferase family 4 protein [Methylovulum miyakonense]|uniref:glycosyltransferase family 4 protein n=1 Tax=Methylovulum miyakonense TaxID=645578 RepID=UPI003BB79FC9
MSIYYLRTSIPWFGNYTGYEQLTKFIEINVSISPKSGIVPRARGKLVSILRGYGKGPQHLVDALWRYERALLKEPNSFGHILYAEHFLRFIPKMPKFVLERTVFTFHQPPSQWSTETLQYLRFVKHSIFLYTKDLDFFSIYLKPPPQTILYGVDTDFFTPPVVYPQLRILFAGVHLRNLKMLRKVIEELQSLHQELAFDFLVPVHHRLRDEFQALADLKNITWHAGLSDEGLRKLYQESYLLLLPMNDSGANTAVVEALACGLPIVTTDVGGIREYGGGIVFHVVENDDVRSMVELVNQYIVDRQFRDQIAQASRKFADEKLSWDIIAKQYISLYQSIQ